MHMEAEEQQPDDFLQVLVDAREYDVPYYVRCSIDLDIRSVPRGGPYLPSEAPLLTTMPCMPGAVCFYCWFVVNAGAPLLTTMNCARDTVTNHEVDAVALLESGCFLRHRPFTFAMLSVESRKSERGGCYVRGVEGNRVV